MKLKNMHKKIKKFVKGFTVIELVIAVAVLSMLTVLITAQFRQGEKTRGVILGTDIMASAIRTAQNLALNPQAISTTCDISTLPQDYQLAINPNSTSFDLLATDKCGRTVTLETYQLPNNVKIAVVGNTIDNIPLSRFKLKFTPPFGTVGYSFGGSFQPFNHLTVTLTSLDGTTTKFVTYDGVSGRVDTEVAIAQGALVNPPPVHSNPPVCTSSDFTLSAPMYPLDHGMRDVTITGVTDPDGDPVAINVINIFQDEPTNPRAENILAWSVDAVGVNTPTASVRAERSGTRTAPGNGRVYHINFAATSQGGSCDGSVAVQVPLTSGGTSVDNGALYDSTVAYPNICNPNLDNHIDNADLVIIRDADGQVATGPDDSRDGNGDGAINVADVRYCQLQQQ